MLMKRVVLGMVLMPLAWSVSAGTVETKVGIDTGYRQADLHWSIAGNSSGCCPNVLSELTWSDLQIAQIKGMFETTFNERIKLFGMLSYGDIFNGDNQDSDYNGDNRTFEFSRSNNDAGEGDLLDASIGIGFLLARFFDERAGREMRLYPKVGYSYHEQNLVVTDGFQTIPALGPFAGLRSTYETVWEGPWVGLALEFELSDSSYLGVEYQYHWADYTGVANWNLRSDLQHPKSFEHTAEGWGHLFDVSYNKRVNKIWGWGLGLLIENWETNDGDDKVFLSNGSILETRLNEVVFTSWVLSFNFDFYF